MSYSSQRGFTLIELILVIAISGALLSLALVGQGQIRAQAQFDASVNKIVSSINDAHNQATAGINSTGAGNGTNGCTSAPDYVFAGIAWVATGPGQIRMDYYKAVPQSTQANESCVFLTQGVSLPSPVRFHVSDTVYQGEAFLRSNDVLNVCPFDQTSGNVSAMFRSGICSAGNGQLTLNIYDSDGRTSQVVVDRSGLAQRRS